MDTTELLKKIQRLEIKTKGLTKQVFSGEYHSAFKGRGMAFSEVRDYQIGDEVRTIDWNVTARFNSPFVKVFEEERELTLMLLIDVSGSKNFATRNKLKKEILKLENKKNINFNQSGMKLKLKILKYKQYSEEINAMNKLQPAYSKLFTDFNEKTIEEKFPHAKPLASGAYGVAYDLGNGQILKVTSDQDELDNAIEVMQHPSSVYVDVYSVNENFNTMGVGYIILEIAIKPFYKNEIKYSLNIKNGGI